MVLHTRVIMITMIVTPRINMMTATMTDTPQMTYAKICPLEMLISMIVNMILSIQ